MTTQTKIEELIKVYLAAWNARDFEGMAALFTELSRTLYLCELTDRPSTYALEAVRDLVLDLVSNAVLNKDWEATLIE